MYMLLTFVLFGLGAGSGTHSRQSTPSVSVEGTWTGPARCLHAGGETLTLSIARTPDGGLSGSTDWARSSSDGKRGPAIPFTTLTVKGSRIVATLTDRGRTVRLDAMVDGETISGGWAIDGDDDRWTFTGRREPPRR